MLRPAFWIAPLLLSVSCGAHVDRCTVDFPVDLASSGPPWVREEPVDRCVASPDLRDRWTIESVAEARALLHESADAAPFRLPLVGFDFLLGRRVDGGVIVVEWVSNDTFRGLRLDVVAANGTVEHVVDEPDDGSEWLPAGLAVGWDGSFLVARWLHDGKASRLTAYAPNGDRKWRLVEPGMSDAPLVDARGRAYVTSVRYDPPGGWIHAIAPEGETLWRLDLGFNRAPTGLGVRPDAEFVFVEAMAALHTPTDEEGVRLYYPFEDSRLCTLSRDGVLRACEAETKDYPETVALAEDGAHRIP